MQGVSARRLGTLVLLASLLASPGTFAAERERRARDPRQWIKRFVITVLDKLGTPGG